MRLKALTDYYYPGHWIHFNTALRVHNFHSLGSIPCLKLPMTHCHNGAGKFKHNHLSHPTGSPFIHLQLGRRTKVHGEGEIRTRALSMRVEGIYQ